MPITHHYILENQLKWNLWHIIETPEEMLLLAESELKNHFFLLNQIRSPELRSQKIAAKLLLKDILGENRFEKMYYLESGKPVLSDHSAHISISHTHNWACVCKHPNKKVGIDIEPLHRDLSSAAEKVFTKKEIDQAEDIENGLLLLWSSKEALYKCEGRKGVSFRNDIYIDINARKGFFEEDVFDLNFHFNEHYLIVTCEKLNIKKNSERLH